VTLSSQAEWVVRLDIPHTFGEEECPEVAVEVSQLFDHLALVVHVAVFGDVVLLAAAFSH